MSLVVGCGYLGLPLALDLLAEGQAVHATVRRAERALELRCLGLHAHALDVLRPGALEAVVAALPAAGYDAFYLVPPSGGPSPEQVVLEGATRAIAALRTRPPRRLVLASSTAVYGDLAGAVVDADTPAQPGDPRGRLLLEGERRWQADAPAVRVVRLAGLYGPGRIIGERDLRAGRPLGGDPEHWLNLIEVGDAARLLRAVARSERGAPVELGCDGQPVRRREYYAGLARLLGLGPPVFQPGEQGLLARAGDRRCDNAVTCARTGWRPRHANWREGVEAALSAAP